MEQPLDIRRAAAEIGSHSAKAAGTVAPLVVALFFAWGFATVLIDTLIPKLKGLFQLNYAEAMLTQFAFFLGYLVFSIPASLLLAKAPGQKEVVRSATCGATGITELLVFGSLEA